MPIKEWPIMVSLKLKMVRKKRKRNCPMRPVKRNRKNRENQMPKKKIFQWYDMVLNNNHEYTIRSSSAKLQIDDSNDNSKIALSDVTTLRLGIVQNNPFIRQQQQQQNPLLQLHNVSAIASKMRKNPKTVSCQKPKIIAISNLTETICGDIQVKFNTIDEDSFSKNHSLRKNCDRDRDMTLTSDVDRQPRKHVHLIDRIDDNKCVLFEGNVNYCNASATEDDGLTNVSVKKLKKLYQKHGIGCNSNIAQKRQKLFQPKDRHQQIYRPIFISRNISVKNLCRSFGDLTNLKDLSLLSISNQQTTANCLKRAKSVGDMLDHNRIVLIGVSVKALRNSYCSLIGGASSDNGTKKSSFSKFDALQKKNILHVRSTDAGRAQEKFSDPNDPEAEKNCRACGKAVYKMEEMKAERNIYHRNCFRCKECGKALNVDTYQSHESVLYCKPHFRQLFAPKAVEDNEPARPRKPELIIRENEPAELPPDVVRASDKTDLGLDELHQLNVKERFQVFENYSENMAATTADEKNTPVGVRRSTSILSKLAKFQKKGLNTGLDDETLGGNNYGESSEEEDDDDEEEAIDENNEDADLIRAKRAQRERPMSFHNMNDIKSKFERGALMTKEERREERKQEIQNIRSRLFMGKQARIKEMYQQAVADSEQAITSTNKKPEIDIGDKARSLKEKFERGEMFKEVDSEEHRLQEEEMAVFEQGLGKQSRSIFMHLDATQQQQGGGLLPQAQQPKLSDSKKQQQVSKLSADKCKPFLSSESGEVVRSTDKTDDIKVETSEISSKFRFFETYRPTEKERKQFRITPPREGVVKMGSPDCDENESSDSKVMRAAEQQIDDPTVAKQTHTATKMLSIFRQMEESQKKVNYESDGLKPLKSFTPPPDGNRRVYNAGMNEEDDDEADEEDEDDEEEEGEEEEESDEDAGQAPRYDDEFLRQAQSAARAKQLRAKFEKWEANEIRREINNGSAVNLYEHYDESEEGQVESAKSLRAKFESLRDSQNSPSSRRQIKVNRFV